MAVFRDVDVNCVSRNQPGGSAKNVPAACGKIGVPLLLVWLVYRKQKNFKNHLVKRGNKKQ